MKPDFTFVLENARWPALLVTSSGVIARSNAEAANLFGPITDGSASLGASIWARDNQTPPETFFLHAERSAAPFHTLKFRIKDGSTSAFQTYVCALTKDEQKYFLLQLLVGNVSAAAPAGQQADSNLAQKQKLDCAMQLVRTVSLDFNNALTSVLGHTSLILNKIEPNHAWRPSLLEIEKSAEKAAEIAADLAAFSRQEKDAKAQTAGNLNDLARRVITLFQTSGTQSVLWGAQLEPKLYSVVFDEAKLQQALVKVMENAIQAAADVGQIVVRTRNVDSATPLQDGTARLAPGSYVCIEVEDAGCGIAPEMLPRIFEPFFTTKDKSKHRGLGLAWVYGIVTNHRGGVAVSSDPGLGTTVRIYLPALKKFVHDEGGGGDDISGTGTILIVDDEEILLTLEETILTTYGYKVLSANNGAKAVEIYSQSAKEIDLVITDLVMPQMAGRELIEKIRQISPEARILCTSGYTRARNAEEEDSFLQKPFRSQDLLKKVKRILSQAPSKAG